MKNVNFRTLENMKAPEALKERLLAIPETSEKKPAGVLWYRGRMAVAAAAAVFISVMGLTVFILFGNKQDIHVKVKPSVTEPVWATDANGETVVPDAYQAPDGSVSYDENGNVIRPDEGVSGTRSPSEATVSPTEKGKPAPTEPADEPPVVTEPTDGPPEPVAPTDPPPDMPDPTAPPDMPDPTAPPDMPDPTVSPYIDVVSDLVYIGEIPDGSVIYCWLYYNNWRMYNDDAYSSMFYADVTPLGDGYAFLDYMPKAHGVDLPNAGHYQYVWYLSVDGSHNGRRLSSGDVYLNN